MDEKPRSIAYSYIQQYLNGCFIPGSIYITDPYHSKASENFVRELLNELKSNCSSVSPEILAAREVKNIDVEKHFCLICVCNNASRIDSDIEFCESYINGNIIAMRLRIKRRNVYSCFYKIKINCFRNPRVIKVEVRYLVDRMK